MSCCCSCFCVVTGLWKGFISHTERNWKVPSNTHTIDGWMDGCGLILQIERGGRRWMASKASFRSISLIYCLPWDIFWYQKSMPSAKECLIFRPNKIPAWWPSTGGPLINWLLIHDPIIKWWQVDSPAVVECVIWFPLQERWPRNESKKDKFCIIILEELCSNLCPTK